MAAKPLQELSEHCTGKMFAWYDRLSLAGLGTPERIDGRAIAPQLFVLQ